MADFNVNTPWVNTPAAPAPGPYANQPAYSGPATNGTQNNTSGGNPTVLGSILGTVNTGLNAAVALFGGKSNAAPTSGSGGTSAPAADKPKYTMYIIAGVVVMVIVVGVFLFTRKKK